MKTSKIIGRETQKRILTEALVSESSEFVVVYGRRRVGKTFLIKNVLARQMDFDMTGIQDGDLRDQLQNFADKLSEYSGEEVGQPDSWMQAFSVLRKYLSKRKNSRRKVIFLDELPWMDTNKSKFLGMLGHFWNDWAAHNNVLLVVCGSAASWMIKNVLDHKGGAAPSSNRQGIGNSHDFSRIFQFSVCRGCSTGRRTGRFVNRSRRWNHQPVRSKIFQRRLQVVCGL